MVINVIILNLNSSGSGSGCDSGSEGGGGSSSSSITSFLVSTQARYLPFKVLDASFGHPIMKCAHGTNYTVFDTC